VTITSGFRCPQNTGGAANSLHRVGRAADFTTSQTPNANAIVAQNLRIPGIARYTGPTNFVHVDTRDVPWWAITTDNGVTFTNQPSGFGGTGTQPASGGCCNAGSSNPPPGGSPVLGTGTVDAAVVRGIQQTLNHRYNTGLAVDGGFGNLTRGAMIRGLQTEINNAGGIKIPVNGVWCATTQSRTPIVQNGSTGNVVYILQAVLYCRRYTNLSITSTFANMTEAEVRSFQNRNNLGVDGRAGPITFARLLSVL
jgi:hypothetical protein